MSSTKHAALYAQINCAPKKGNPGGYNRARETREGYVSVAKKVNHNGKYVAYN